mmetsp:Transcript_4240/g.8112  ORF Transcript_4240/g.8112 Transcript_4240/m.8112 type:complete len:466 (+) Transcript_4240:160-1557(+)
MWVHLIFNVITTALYTIVFEIGQDVYGNANAAFYNLCVSVIQFAMGSILLVVISLREKAVLREVSLESPPVIFSNAVDTPSEINCKTTDWYFVRSILIIAVCCSIANFVWAVTGVQVKASLQSIMGLLLIPCTYLLTITLLKRKMPILCQVGACLVVFGALVAALGGLISRTSSVGAGGDDHDDEDNDANNSSDRQDSMANASIFTVVMCYLMFEGMNLPYAYQYIVSERLFHKGYGLWALEVYSGWLEVGFLLLLAPLQGILLRLLGQKPEEFSFSAGFDCMLGSACLDDGDGGQMVPWWPAFILFAAAVSSVMNDFAYLLLTKYGSAVYMTVADGFSVSVVGVVTTFRFMGRYREGFSVFTLVSCVICTLGMIAWVKGEEQGGRQDIRKEDNMEVLQLEQQEEEQEQFTSQTDECQSLSQQRQLTLPVLVWPFITEIPERLLQSWQSLKEFNYAPVGRSSADS